jgi:hypothetical protein
MLPKLLLVMRLMTGGWLGVSALADAAEVAAAALVVVGLVAVWGLAELPLVLLLMLLVVLSAEKLMQLPPTLHVTCTASSHADTPNDCACW